MHGRWEGGEGGWNENGLRGRGDVSQAGNEGEKRLEGILQCVEGGWTEWMGEGRGARK